MLGIGATAEVVANGAVGVVLADGLAAEVVHLGQRKEGVGLRVADGLLVQPAGGGVGVAVVEAVEVVEAQRLDGARGEGLAGQGAGPPVGEQGGALGPADADAGASREGQGGEGDGEADVAVWHSGVLRRGRWERRTIAAAAAVSSEPDALSCLVLAACG